MVLQSPIGFKAWNVAHNWGADIFRLTHKHFRLRRLFREPQPLSRI